jgi:hypothetical protein
MWVTASACGQTIFELANAGATTGTGPATAADIINRTSAIIDHCVDVALGGWVADTNQH